MRIRSYEVGDGVAGVVAGAYRGDPALGAMSLGLHGPARDGEAWRRTVVAVDGDDVVGVGSAAASRQHPGSAPVAVVVSPRRRRNGIGSALLAAVREEIAGFAPPPLWSTVDSRDPAAAGFAAAHGFGPVSRYGMWRLDPVLITLPAADETVALTGVADLSEEQRIDAFAALDRWGGNTALAEPTPREVIRTDVLPGLLPGLLPGGGVVALVDGRPIAVGMLGDFDGELIGLCGAADDRAVPGVLAGLLAAAGGRTVELEVPMDGGAGHHPGRGHTAV
jgi:GNAT superfamily N-acetyltransferase